MKKLNGKLKYLYTDKIKFWHASICKNTTHMKANGKYIVNLDCDNLVAASDAFFPFVDGIEKLIQSGVRAVVQPSGSIRDKEIINFANETDTVLLFSKTRHFRH